MQSSHAVIEPQSIPGTHILFVRRKTTAPVGLLQPRDRERGKRKEDDKGRGKGKGKGKGKGCLLYTSPSPRDKRQSRMPSSA